MLTNFKTCAFDFLFKSLLYFDINEIIFDDKIINLNNLQQNDYKIFFKKKYLIKGVSADEAKEIFNVFLNKINSELSFNYTPFSKVDFYLFNDFLIDLEKKNYFVGVGYNHGRLSNNKKIFKHVTRIKSTENKEKVKIEINQNNINGVIEYDWSKIESAVFDVKSGFWYIGNKII